MKVIKYILAALIAVSSISVAESEKHLFILSGQSNMAGLDPKLSFTPAVEEAFGAENVVVVKHAHGGMPIRRWYKNWKPAEGYVSPDGSKPEAKGDLYDRLMKEVNPAIEGKEFTTVTFLWMQGEKDAKEMHGEVYAASLKGLISQLSEDLGRDDLNFVLGRLSDFEGEKYVHWDIVREAQVAVAEGDPRGAWVNTDDLNDGVNKKGRELKDDLHYSVEGYKTLGERFAQSAIELIKK